MLRLVVPVILLLLMLFGGAVWLISHRPRTEQPQIAREEPQKRAKPAEAAAIPDSLEDLSPAPVTPPKDGAPSFDIARIDPKGTSVFAGRAEPGSTVVITADGQDLGSAEADANGEWTFTTEQANNADAKLGLYKAPPGYRPKVASSETRADTPPPAAAAAAPSEKSATAVTSKMIKNLEGMVEAARVPEPPVAANDPAKIADDVPPSTTLTAKLPDPSAAPPQSAPPALSLSVPVPITFVFNEPTLTGEGRRAAQLLLEYLQLKRFPKVTLTGHADERGTDALNMNLSRDRLETVARLLREGGFKGQLELVPKGKSEPYNGVVRGDFNQEDLWQLDRRVELVVRP